MEGFKRKEIDITLAGTCYRLRGLVPADFLGEDCWPFRFYRLKDAHVHECEWNWEGGIKPKWMLKAEERVRKILSCGVVSPKIEPNDLVSLCQDKSMKALKDLLVGIIFMLSYGAFDPAVFTEESILDRNHLTEIGIKARELCREPWEIMFGASGLPEGFNPKRYDFNTIVLSVMIERDAETERRHHGRE